MIARFRALATRTPAGIALLDGDHLVAEALAAGVPLEVVLGDERAAPLLARARAAGAATFEASAAVLSAARPVRGAAGGAVALAAWSARSLDAVFRTTPPVVLGLVDVQDPGNLGSAIRSADALDAGAVLALGDSAHPGGWKALRGAMGSTFHLPVGRGSTADALALARQHGLAVAATVAEGGTPIEEANLTQPLLVLVGNEGAGLPAEIVGHADLRLTIPMRPSVNSLNVSVTAALVLWVRRHQAQRRARTPL